MRTKTELILDRGDLLKIAEKIPFEQIGYHLFKCSYRVMINTDKVIFKDDDGRIKILKNRFDE